MNKLFGNHKRKRIISFFLLISFVSEILTPTATLALTGGPSQPEVEAFTPVNTSEMVDLSSGDFKYNIPLMDVGGYPLNIAYNSGIGMDQEATWVGLGWNLNVGAINRNMRGLPDDFDGEEIHKEFNMKDNNTYGVNVGVGFEVFGWKKAGKKQKASGSINLSVGLGLTYNNYTGIGMEHSISMGISAGNSGKGSMNSSLGLKSSNSGGLSISPNLSFSYQTDERQKSDVNTTGSVGIGIGLTMNSKRGVQDLSFNASYSRTSHQTQKISGENVKTGESVSKGSATAYSTISFGASTYIPQISNSMVNNSVALSFKLGTTIIGIDADITLAGYFSNQSQLNSSSDVPAFGYMFSHDGQQSPNVLMDFNREHDGSFTRYTKNLPVTNQTYDVFSVSGQGIGGAFRPFRSDVGYMFDNASTTTSDSYSGGVEFAATNTAHLGVNISVVDVHTTTGKWSDDNYAKEKLSSRGSGTGGKAYEPYYFREVGEKSENDVQDKLYNDLGADEAYRVQVKGLINHKANEAIERVLSPNTIDVKSLNGTTNYISKRQKRNQVMSTLSFAEAKLYGLDKGIYTGTNTTMNLNNSGIREHSIAEMTVLRSDGSRYIYGLPAFNTKQLEVTFNASAKTTSDNYSKTPANTKYLPPSGYVKYDAKDRSKDNKNGIDHYFNSVSMPSYAHSYLLTSIISPDYVDLTGDGPTDDDHGTYTKFTYTSTPNYNWRTPFSALGNEANFNANGKSIENDDQGSFVAGTKDLWFTTSIETKNYIAIFELEDRQDAIGAAGENGGKGSQRTKFIKFISLYSKPEYLAYGVNAVPIKVAHFEYDYSLCKGIPNNTNQIAGSIPTNEGGKLTLKSIYFTYGKSDKASFSKYNFDYGQYATVGPGATFKSNFYYNPQAYDRWGNYMPVNNLASNYNAVTPPPSGYDYSSPMTNSEFPYTDQYSKADADYRASAWNLSQIKLPSGGEIKIKYESDDYAFVQNRPAMQMMKVLGVDAGIPTTGAGTINSVADLYTNKNSSNLYLKFELTQPLVSTTTTGIENEIRNNYLKDINDLDIKAIKDRKYLGFRFLVNMTNLTPGHANSGDHFEYVSGYAELEGGLNTICGVVNNSSTGQPFLGPNQLPIAYVKLKSVSMDGMAGGLYNINPIAKAAMNFGKCHFNNLVSDASFSPPSDVIGAVKQLATEAATGFAKTLIQTIQGPNLNLVSKDYCKQFVIGKSWVRLYNPNGHKFGGGSRVKELAIIDNWSSQTGGQADSEYGQSYTYETELNGATISSGVASYEPMQGGDENPFRQPVFMGPNSWTLLTPDERFFMEEPFGETFFPSASICYSKVTVKNKIPDAVLTKVKTHGTGYVVHEFYTAKDYPTITSHSPLDQNSVLQYKPLLGSLLKVMGRDYVVASQGYVIKNNDMQCKEKAQSVYAEGSSTPLSKVEYFYKTKGGGYVDYGLKSLRTDASCMANELDNTCLVINKDGSIASKTIGMDFDAVADFRENETTTIMGGAQINLSLFLVGAFPGLVPSLWPDFSYEKTRFRSSVLTKVQCNYGILERTTAQDLGSRVTTSNLAYDAQTGDVLVTKTKNDFEDDIYSLKYPSFWGYDLMGPAYKNIGLNDNVNFIGGGVANTANANLYYNIGDELGIGGNVGWVCNVTTSQISVIDKLGNPVANTGATDIQVLRSGRRNLLSSQMSSLTSLVNPLDNDNNGILDAIITINTNNKVLNTSAIEYSDQWQTYKGYTISNCPTNTACSPTPDAVDWLAFLNELLQRQTLVSGDLVASGLPLSTFYYSTWTPLLQNNWSPSNGAPTWATNISVGIVGGSPNRLQCGVFNAPNQYNFGSEIEGCGNTLILPTGYDWSSPAFQALLAPQNGSNPSFSFASPVGTTGNPHQIDLNLSLSNGTTVGVNFYANCDLLVSCYTPPQDSVKCGVDAGDLVNPFVYGIRGNWRPKTTWSYLEGRTQTLPGSSNNVNIRKDGYITNYTPFYTPNSGADWGKNYPNWTFTSEINKHTPNGVEVENKDALNRYSSALYGYKESLPIAVASNAQLQEIAYDGFEDYDYSSGACNKFAKEHHFDFYPYKASLVSTTAHTGKYSIRVESKNIYTISKNLISTAPIAPQTSACNYVLRTGDFIYPFAPITYNGAKRYIVSYWVKEKLIIPSTAPIFDYTHSYLRFVISCGSGQITLGSTKKSQIIDGWQRIETDFTIPANATGKLNISLVNSSSYLGSVDSYFDDIRIHPYNSNIKSFVYHPVTLKYVAELDANNFATFYEYDEEGSLTRVKKETEKGIMTIQETKNHTKK